MKKFSAKRVFAIFGIVFLGVAAFAGAVLGVMALMGKFKTPIVYPTELVFLDNDRIVIEGQTYNPAMPWNEQLLQVYKIELEGTNSSEEHPVNQKDCYIWFYQNVGSNLITLCNAEGEPLVKDSNNRYKVKCNEPIYYLINKVDEDAVTDGKVMLMARSENNKAQADVPLTLWIDRKIEQINVVDTNLNSEKPTTVTQHITVGVDISFDFEYEIKTPLSLKPIGKESEKQIELYYVATGYSADYIRITEEETLNPESPVSEIVSFEDNVFSFKASKAGQYVFKIGAFKTYQYKMDYLASIEGQTITNPNYHRTSCLLSDGSPAMVLTTLTVTVENIDVNEAGFRGTNVVLNLYSDKDYITLNGTSGVEGAKDNNLELYMKKGDYNWVYDNSRFDEVTMAGFADAWAEKVPEFISPSTSQRYNVESLYFGDLVLSNVYLDKDKKLNIIERFETGTDEYYCMNGVAVWDEENNAIRMLKEGSYLNFYVQDINENETFLADFNYSASTLGSGDNKTWNITTKEIPNLLEGQELKMGILVVNKRGKFEIGKFFDTVDVLISEVVIDYSVKTAVADLDVSFLDATQNGGKTLHFAEKPFDDFVTINSGSYNAVVLVTKEPSIIKTVQTIKFTVGTEEYYLVGDVEVDEVTGEKIFVNKVVVDQDVSSLNKSATLKLLQLKNNHNETVDDIINSLIKDIDAGVDISTKVNNAHSTTIVKSLLIEDISINSKYIINTNLLNYGFFEAYVSKDDNIPTTVNGDNYQVYEKTGGHKIVITAPNNVEMIGRIVEYYNINRDSFTTSQQSNLWVDEAIMINGRDEGGILKEAELVVTYQADRCLSNTDTVITVALENVGTDVTLPNGILIISGSPDAIMLHNGAGNSIALSSQKTDAEQSSNYLKVDVEYAAAGYVYQFSLQSGENNYPIDKSKNALLFNKMISQLAGVTDIVGFQADKDKGQLLEVYYDSMNKTIFNTDKLFDADKNPLMRDLVESAGETIVKVEIGETVNYLKVKTDTSKFELLNIENKTSFEESSENRKLSTMVELKYDNTTTLSLSKDKLVYVDNLVCLKYGNGSLIQTGDRNNGWTLTREDGQWILKVYDAADGNGWIFEKNDNFISLAIRFDVVSVAGTETIDLTFTSAINFSVGEQWANNRVLYAGTTVLLFANVVDKNAPGRKHPVIECSEMGVKYWIKYQGIEEEITSENFEVLEKHIGNISIVLKFDNETIYEFTGFVVKPNVIAQLNMAEPLKSESPYGVDNIYDLYSYKVSDNGNNVVYGEKDIWLYRDTMLESLSSTENLTVIADSEGNKINENYWAYVEYCGDNISDKYVYDATNATYKLTTDKSRQSGVKYYTKYERKNLTEGNLDPTIYWEYAVYTGTDVTGKFIKTMSGYERTSDTVAQPGVVYYTCYDNQFYIDRMVETNTELTRKVHLKYVYEVGSNKYTTTVTTSNILIANNHKADFAMNGENNKLVFKAITEYESFATITGFNLVSVEADNLEFSVTEVVGGNNKFKLNTVITTELKDVLVKLTFASPDGSQTLVLYNEITLIPFSPKENTTTATIYSGFEYDLFTTRYDITNIEDKDIDKLVVKSIQDMSGNDITATVLKAGYTLGGYIGVENPVCGVEFAEIPYDMLDVNIEYEITFENGISYSYLIKSTIVNRQSILVEYPEKDLDFGAVNFKMVAGYEGDGEYLSGEESENGIYSIEVGTFEAVPVYTNSTNVLNFIEDDVKKIQRVLIEDRKTPTDNDVVNDKDVRITIIGYQDLYGLSEYIYGLKTVKNEFVLPRAPENGLAGMLLFKLETASENTKYYFVYVYCVGNSATINSNNNLKVLAHLNDTYLQGADNLDIATYKLTYDIANNNYTTYGKLIEDLSNNADLFGEINGYQTYNSTFGNSYKLKGNIVTKLYLYEISELGSDEEYDYNSYEKYTSIDETLFNEKKAEIYVKDGENYNLVDEETSYDDTVDYYCVAKNILGKDVKDEIVVLNKQFNTITIGLLYYDGIAMFNYGTITIYIQPTVNLEINDSKLHHIVPNGEFYRTLTGNEKENECPFNGSWIAEIVSVDNNAYDKNIYENYEIPVGSTTLNIYKYVEEDAVIRVKYTRDNGTIVYVNYKYEAVVLPENEKVMNIGQFNNGFITKIDMTSETEKIDGVTYREYFFGSYDPTITYAYEITGYDANYIECDDNILKFKQTHEKKQLSITITYNYYDEPKPTRTFYFNLDAGIHTEGSDGTESGVTSSTPALTTINPDFKVSNIGSTLPIYYYQPAGATYYVYEIAGLKIYTHKASKLNLSFDDGSYVLDSTGKILGENTITTNAILETNVDITNSEYLKNLTQNNINFINSPKDKPIVMTIKVLTDEGETYIVRNFFIKVAKTYSGLVATYCANDTEYAGGVKVSPTHENVAYLDESTAENTWFILDDKLMKSDTSIDRVRRVQLLDADGVVQTDADLSQMGFIQDKNPNRIAYSVSGNATITDEGKIIFNKVTKNSICRVGLSNNAGLKDVYYTYQIMPSSKSDGLDFTTTNGYIGENYLSFTMSGDVGDTFESDRYVLGTMLDLSNPGVIRMIVDREELSGGKRIESIEEDEEFNTYANAIQFKKVHTSGYHLYFIFDLDTYQLELIVRRPLSTTKLNELMITLSVGGVNGKDTILKDYKILLHNYEVTSNFEYKSDDDVYAYYYINLETDGKFVNKTGNANIFYKLAESTYTVDNIELKISADETNNELFTFDENTKSITFKVVGRDVDAELRFNVVFKDEESGIEYVVDNLLYKVVVKRNLQFMVNGATTVNKDSSLETNFVLTPQDSDGFEYKVNFMENSKVNTTTSDPNANVTETGYYNVLAFDLYKLKNKGQTNPKIETLLMDRMSACTVTLLSQEFRDCVKVDNTGIIFYKDFTGLLELELAVNTSNGTYTDTWAINVSGIKTVIKKGEETTKLTTSSRTSYDSGSLVKLVHFNSDYDVGVVLKNAEAFTSKNVQMTFVYDYKVFTSIDGADVKLNKDLYDSTANLQGSGNGSWTTSANPSREHSNECKVNLPRVPITNNQNPQAYIVVYRVYVEYLGLEYDTDIDVDEKQEVKVVYCAYMVENRQQISVADNATVDVTSSTELPLMYYAEKYKNGSDEYLMIYSDGNLKISSSTSSYTCDLTSESNGIYTFNSDSGTTDKIYYNSATNIVSFNDIRFTDPKSAVRQTKDSTLFDASFNNMIDYMNFIKPFIDKPGENYAEIGTIAQFKLQEIETDSGKYGIDLSSDKGGTAFDDKDNPLFTNEMVEEFKLMQSNVAVFKIDKFSTHNPTGFKLTTSATITPNTENVTISNLFLEQYFTKGDEYIKTADLSPIAGKIYYKENSGNYEKVVTPTRTEIGSYYEYNDVDFYTEIIGVGYTGFTDWVNNKTAAANDIDTCYATIKIPTDSGTYDLEIRKVIYTGSPSGIYNIRKEFFFVFRDNSTDIVTVPDYSKVGYGGTYFKIAYNKYATENQEFDIAKAFTVWGMDGGVLTNNRLSTLTKLTPVINITEDDITAYSELSLSGKILQITNEALNNEKLKNPNKKEYAPFTLIIKVNGIEFVCDVVFDLPSYPTFNSETYGVDDINIQLKDKLYIPDENGGFKVLDDTKLANVLNVSQKTTADTSEDFIKKYIASTGVLTLDSAKINEYFTKNLTEETLYLLFELTTEDYKTLTFQVIVKKTV